MNGFAAFFQLCKAWLLLDEGGVMCGLIFRIVLCGSTHPINPSIFSPQFSYFTLQSLICSVQTYSESVLLSAIQLVVV